MYKRQFKGYLVAGEHLKDLDRFRGQYRRKTDTVRVQEDKALRGDLRHVEIQSDTVTPFEEDEKSVKHEEKFESKFLTDVYSKVYGSLGKFSKPLNSSARKNNGLDPRSINLSLIHI